MRPRVLGRALRVVQFTSQGNLAAVRCKAIDDGVPVPDIARATYGEK
jgi:hypothetical protein